MKLFSIFIALLAALLGLLALTGMPVHPDLVST
jgi:hypothetical protein